MYTQTLPQVHLPDISSDNTESDSDSSTDQDSPMHGTDSANDSELSFEAPSITSLSSSSSESSDTEDDRDEIKPSADKTPSSDNKEQSTNFQDPKTYRLNGDNIDYNEASRYQRSNAGNKSRHFFQYYAVKDRIDFSHLSTIPPDISALSKKELCQSMLPSVDDDVAIKHNIICLVARVLCKYVPFFKHTYDGVLEKHIKHQYYKQMSSKSEVVCCN